MSAPGLLADRKSTARCTLCEARLPLAQLRQGGGHNNYRCVEAKACTARALEQVGPDEGDTTYRQHSYVARRADERPTSCGACEKEGAINKHGLCVRCEDNFVAANPGKER